MAQSRMAGVAMGLGPDDLADVGEAKTLATNKMGMEQGNTASVIINLDRGYTSFKNDGSPTRGIVQGGKSVRLPYREKDKYPIPGRGYNSFETQPLSEGEFRRAADYLHKYGRYD